MEPPYTEAIEMAESRRAILELPVAEGKRSARLVLETDDSSAPITLVRRGNDVFFLSRESEVVAAFVRMGATPTAA